MRGTRSRLLTSARSPLLGGPSVEGSTSQLPPCGEPETNGEDLWQPLSLELVSMIDGTHNHLGLRLGAKVRILV